MYKTSHKQKAGWRLKSVLLSLLLLFSGAVIFGQERSISGTIVDNSGAPLPGVNVIIKGTTTGTVSDMDGKFTIKADASATLEFKYVGYLSQEIPVGGQTSFSVTMKEDVQELNEVVVIGYGVQKKKLNTGATLNVAGENIQALKTNSPIEALKGITPGVTIIQNSGLPGAGTRVNIRGVGTIGNSKPLYIVDGIAVGDIDYLSPSDIESIDVLKDAASSAIYGSRAANGVVLVTTKTGAKDMKTVVTYDGYYGVSNIYKKPEMLNAKQYMEIMDEANYNTDPAGYAKKAYKWATLVPDYDKIMSGEWNGTNWVDEIENKNAVTQSHALNIMGGSKKSTYSLGASYFTEEGVLGKQTNNKYKRINLRMNTTQVIWEKNNNAILTVGENLTFTNTKKPTFRTGNIYWNDLHNMLVTSPILRAYDSVGNYAPPTKWNLEEANPIALMEYNCNSSYNDNNNINASAFAELQPIKGLIFRSAFSGSNWYGSSRSWVPKYYLTSKTFTTRDVVNQSMYEGFTWTWTNTATYNQALGQHNFTFLLGNEMTKNTQNLSLEGKNENSLFQDAEHAYLKNVPVVDASYTTITGKDEYGWGLLSYFGRLSYDYKETYMFTFVLRADGSSNFPEGHRWGTFPSVSAGWLVSNEPFMDWSKDLVSSLKLRASWGQNGNQDMPNGKFQYLAAQTYDNSSDYFFGTDKTARTAGCYPEHVANYDLTWETSEQTDLGLDLYLYNNKLQFTFDYYNKETKDWL
ncbi:MAG TPA: SusC/RagA family TonB-linked outer membrane protein, partial [Bacteroidales bacterium]